MTSTAVDGLRLAVGTLSRWPTRPPSRVDRDVARVAMLAAPLTAVPLGVVWVAAHVVVVHTSAPALLVGAVVVGATALWSRGLHLDGLADTCDGLSASHDRDRALAVMKTGDVGPSGAVALGVTLLVQAAALGALLGSPGGTVLALAALALSRHTLAWGCARFVPLARDEGLGAAVGRSVGPVPLVTALVLVGALAVVATRPTTTPAYAAPLVLLAGLAGGGWVLQAAARRLGGMTGDVLGAMVEVSLAVALATATLLV